MLGHLNTLHSKYFVNCLSPSVSFSSNKYSKTDDIVLQLTNAHTKLLG